MKIESGKTSCIWCEKEVDPRLLKWDENRSGCQWCGKPILVAYRTRLGEVCYTQQFGLDNVFAKRWTPEELEAIATHLRMLHKSDEPVFLDDSGEPDSSGKWSK